MKWNILGGGVVFLLILGLTGCASARKHQAHLLNFLVVVLATRDVALADLKVSSLHFLTLFKGP